MTAREIERLIRQAGWVEIRCKGGHMQFGHKDKPHTITIPQHSGDISKGTAHSILKAAGLK